MQGIETGWLSALLLIDLIDSSDWLSLSNDDDDDGDDDDDDEEEEDGDEEEDDGDE